MRSPAGQLGGNRARQVRIGAKSVPLTSRAGNGYFRSSQPRASWVGSASSPCIESEWRVRGETNLSAESNQAVAQAWLPRPNEDPRGSGCSQAPAAEEPEAALRLRGVEVVGERVGVSPSTGRFCRADRLRLSRDFERVARQGTRVAVRDFVMLVAPARQTPAGNHPVRRLGITASRKVGPAIQRNRVKRTVREWFRDARSSLGEDLDVVVIARPGAGQLDGKQLRQQLNELLSRIAERTGPADG